MCVCYIGPVENFSISARLEQANLSLRNIGTEEENGMNFEVNVPDLLCVVE
jgi:hypothetical protein